MKEGQEYLIYSEEDYMAEQDECLAYFSGQNKNRKIDIQTRKVLAALNDNRKSLGWIPQSMKQYHM